MSPFIQKTVYSDLPSDYRNYAIEVRGRILNDIAEMEREIDDYICRYFCTFTKKRNELMEIIVATQHLTFRSKADILRCLLEKRKDVTKSQATKIHDILLKKIASKRNTIAHCILDNSIGRITNFKNNPQKTIYFLKYSNTKKPVELSKTDVIALSELIFQVKQFVWRLTAQRYRKTIKKRK